MGRRKDESDGSEEEDMVFGADFRFCNFDGAVTVYEVKKYGAILLSEIS